MATETTKDLNVTLTVTPRMISDSFRRNLMCKAIEGKPDADIPALVLRDIQTEVERAFRPMILTAFEGFRKDPAVINAILQRLDSKAIPGIDKRPASPELLRKENPWLVAMLEHLLRITPEDQKDQPDLPNIK